MKTTALCFRINKLWLHAVVMVTGVDFVGKGVSPEIMRNMFPWSNAWMHQVFPHLSSSFHHWTELLTVLPLLLKLGLLAATIFTRSLMRLASHNRTWPDTLYLLVLLQNLIIEETVLTASLLMWITSVIGMQLSLEMVMQWSLQLLYVLE